MAIYRSNVSITNPVVWQYVVEISKNLIYQKILVLSIFKVKVHVLRSLERVALKLLQIACQFTFLICEKHLYNWESRFDGINKAPGVWCCNCTDSGVVESLSIYALLPYIFLIKRSELLTRDVLSQIIINEQVFKWYGGKKVVVEKAHNLHESSEGSYVYHDPLWGLKFLVNKSFVLSGSSQISGLPKIFSGY